MLLTSPFRNKGLLPQLLETLASEILEMRQPTSAEHSHFAQGHTTPSNGGLHQITDVGLQGADLPCKWGQFWSAIPSEGLPDAHLTFPQKLTHSFTSPSALFTPWAVGATSSP